jgi:hypothetical protein
MYPTTYRGVRQGRPSSAARPARANRTWPQRSCISLSPSATEVANAGRTFASAHRTKQGCKSDPFILPESGDIPHRGFQEWFRQRLVGRWKRYEPRSRQHHLQLNVGGSVGRSTWWAIDVSERAYDESMPPRWAGTRQHADVAPMRPFRPCKLKANKSPYGVPQQPHEVLIGATSWGLSFLEEWPRLAVSRGVMHGPNRHQARYPETSRRSV